MTKFEEMCAALATGRKNWIDYHSRCAARYAKLVGGFIAYCQIPDSQIKVVPVDQNGVAKDEKGRTYSVPGAMEWNSDNRRWSLGVRLKLRESPNSFPEHPVLLVLYIWEKGEKVFVQYDAGGEEQEIDVDSEKDRAAFYDFIVDRIKTYYSTSIVDVSDAVKTVGFLGATK
jgi:hypothetical protein